MKISTSESRPVRVGILALFSQNTLFNENGQGKKTGGAEKRSILLAEMLKELGYPVDLVLATPPWYCRKPTQVKGFSLHYHKRYRRNGRMIVRKVYRSSLWNRIVDKIRVSIGWRPRDIEAINRRLYFDDFERVRADVWLALSVNDTSLHLAEYCFKTNRSFILGLAHDLDLDFMVNPSGRDVYGASRLAKRIALSRAHTILVQNKFQQEQVLQAFPSKPVYFLRNPIKIPELESSNPRLGTGVLWVGKFHSNKNPIGLVRIAKLLPGISFTMICNAGQRDVEEEIKSSLPMNVKLI
jgi:glycosyltransferase involved in cell wall biosynthesis